MTQDMDNTLRPGDLVRVLSTDETCRNSDKLGMIGNVCEIFGMYSPVPWEPQRTYWVWNTTRTAMYLFNINQLEKINITFEENNMDKVIQYWADRQLNILEKKHAEQTRLIIDKDINIITLRQALDDGAKVCEKFGVEFTTNIDYEKLYSDKTMAELRKDGTEYTEQRDKIRNTAVAAERLCNDCDTNEQRVQVLKTYGILNSEGVLDV